MKSIPAFLLTYALWTIGFVLGTYFHVVPLDHPLYFPGIVFLSILSVILMALTAVRRASINRSE